MLRATVPFVIGLLLARAVDVPLTVCWAVFIGAFGWWVVKAHHRNPSFAQRWWRGFYLLPIFFALGVLWQTLRTPALHRDDVARLAAEAEGWEVDVLEVASANARTARLWVDVDAALIHGEAQRASGRLLLTVLRDSTQEAPAYGDRLLVLAQADSIARVPDPGGFDLRQWASGYNVTHECFAPKERWRTLAHGLGSWMFFEEARNHITRWLRNSGLGERERALVKAVLLGVRDELDSDQKAAFARSGTMHVLAVSGSHVAVIYAAFVWGFTFLGQRKHGRLLRGVLALLALWSYAGLTGFTPSVLRATVTFTFFTVAEMLDRRTEPLNSLSASAFVLLIWDPSMLVQLSFQLSFLAVLGIALFYRPLNLAWAPPNAVMRFFWSLFSVSLAAQAFTTPLSLLVFKAFPVWFLPANMVIVGLVTLCIYGGALLVLFHAVPVLGAFLSQVVEWMLQFLGWSSTFFAQLPGAYPSVRIDTAQCIVLYVLVCCLAGWWVQRWHWARTAAAGAALLVLVQWGIAAHQRNTQQQFVVYDDRSALTCAVVNGRSMTVFTRNDDAWTKAKVMKHERSVGAEELTLIDSLPSGLKVGAQRILFLEPKDLSTADLSLDTATTVVLMGEGWLDKAALEKPVQAWILSPSLDRRARSVVLGSDSLLRAPLHDIRTQGAYVR